MISVTIDPKIQDGCLKLPKNMKKGDQMYRKEIWFVRIYVWVFLVSASMTVKYKI